MKLTSETMQVLKKSMFVTLLHKNYIKLNMHIDYIKK